MVYIRHCLMIHKTSDFSGLGGLEIPTLPFRKCCRHFPKFRATVYGFLLRKAFPTIFHQHSGHPTCNVLSYAVERKGSPKVIHQLPRAVSPNPVLRDKFAIPKQMYHDSILKAEVEENPWIKARSHNTDHYK